MIRFIHVMLHKEIQPKSSGNPKTQQRHLKEEPDPEYLFGCETTCSRQEAHRASGGSL